MAINRPEKLFGKSARRFVNVAIVMGISFATVGTAMGQSTKELSPDEVRQLVVELGSDQFSNRQTATLKLVAAGKGGIHEIERAISLGDADFRLRAFGVLKILAIDHRSELKTAAIGSLQRLERNRLPAVSRDAAATLHLIGLMEQSSIAKGLANLGAKISLKQHTDEGRDFSVPQTVEIPSAWNGTKADLLLISKLGGITQLSFNTDDVDDVLIEQISNLSSLKSLSIKRANISNRSVNSLTKLENLESLEILYCPIDHGCIDMLLECQTLSNLRLIGTGVSVDYLTDLAEKLSADVDIRRGAFMGIYYSRGSNQCRLTNVAIGSGAENAGLQSGDLIVGIDGHKIVEPADLTNHLRIKNVGERGSVRFVRDGTEFEVEIVFGQWE